MGGLQARGDHLDDVVESAIVAIWAFDLVDRIEDGGVGGRRTGRRSAAARPL